MRGMKSLHLLPVLLLFPCLGLNGQEPGNGAGDLVQRLEAGNPEVRARVQKEIVESYEPALAVSLLERLHSKDRDLKSRVIFILGEVREKKALEPLLDVLEEEPVFRREALVALAKIGDDYAVESIVDLLDTLDPKLKRLAVWALGKIGSGEALPAVRSLWLSDKDPSMKLAAALALFLIRNDRDAHRQLAMTLNSKFPSLRAETLRLVAESGSLTFVDVLLERLEDAGEEESRELCSALEKITGQGYGRDFRAWKRWSGTILTEDEAKVLSCTGKIGEWGGRIALSYFGRKPCSVSILDDKIAGWIAGTLIKRTSLSPPLYLEKTLYRKRKEDGSFVHLIGLSLSTWKLPASDPDIVEKVRKDLAEFYGTSREWKLVSRADMEVRSEYIEKVMKYLSSLGSLLNTFQDRKGPYEYPIALTSGDTLVFRQGLKYNRVAILESSRHPNMGPDRLVLEFEEYDDLEDLVAHRKGRRRKVVREGAGAFEVPMGNSILRWGIYGLTLPSPQRVKGEPWIEVSMRPNVERVEDFAFAKDLDEFYRKSGIDEEVQRICSQGK